MHLKLAQPVVLALALAAAGAAVPAAEIEIDGSRIVVSGMLDGSALPEFMEHVNSGHVRTVMFENSMGGSADVAEAYAQVIRAKGLVTEARGQCQAACAYAFLAGKEHRFGRGGQVNALLIPVPRRPTVAELQAGDWRADDVQHAQAPAAVASAPAAAVSVSEAPSHAGGPVDAPAADTPVPAAPAKDAWSPGKGVLFTSTPTFFGRVYNTYYCDGNQGSDLSRCDRLSDADPYKLGVLSQ
jgi:hypothetical protein